MVFILHYFNVLAQGIDTKMTCQIFHGITQSLWLYIWEAPDFIQNHHLCVTNSDRICSLVCDHVRTYGNVQSAGCETQELFVCTLSPGGKKPSSNPLLSNPVIKELLNTP